MSNGWDGMGLVIIGVRSSKSTFGANNKINMTSLSNHYHYQVSKNWKHIVKIVCRA